MLAFASSPATDWIPRGASTATTSSSSPRSSLFARLEADAASEAVAVYRQQIAVTRNYLTQGGWRLVLSRVDFLSDDVISRFDPASGTVSLMAFPAVFIGRFLLPTSDRRS